MSLNDVAIVAYSETKTVTRSDRHIWELGAEVLEGLLDQAGMDKAEIDGLVLTASATGAGEMFWSQLTADFLGLELDFCQTVDLGGSSGLGAVARSALAIDAGLCSAVVVLIANKPASESHRRSHSFVNEWLEPFGIRHTPATFGMLSKRYEYEHGLDYSALGKLAVTQREHALLNDLACEKLRKPITIDDYLSSRMIADPLRLLDCVMLCDGASGILMVSRDLAKRKGYSQFAVPIGYGERTNHGNSLSHADILDTGHGVAGARAFAAAGLLPTQISSIHPYDDFIIAIMLQLEALGFCERGQGSAFIQERSFRFDGDLPLNTGGGQISSGQVGSGGTNLVEAVRQVLGGGGARQVQNCDNALVTGIGWIPYGRNWATSTALILSADG